MPPVIQRRFVGFAVACIAATGCNGASGVETLAFACRATSECASGFRCDPSSFVCVRESTMGQGGGAGGGSATGGGTADGTGGGTAGGTGGGTAGGTGGGTAGGTGGGTAGGTGGGTAGGTGGGTAGGTGGGTAGGAGGGTAGGTGGGTAGGAGGGTPAGLVLALSFNEASGTAFDSSGRSNNGTPINATRTAGKYGNGIATVAMQNSSVQVNASASLDLTSGMTLEAWARATGYSGDAPLIQKEGNFLAYAMAMAWPNNMVPANSYSPVGYITLPAGPVALVRTITPPLNTWVHSAVTYDGVTLRLYSNGVEVATQVTNGGALRLTPGPLRIGGDYVYASVFAGTIDEVRIYNRALTQPEIAADMANPLP